MHDPEFTSTLEGETSTLGDVPMVTTAPGLTIAWHPDPQRVGDRVPFSARRTDVSRHVTTFYDPSGRATGPIADPYVSRTPVSFLDAGGVIEIGGRCVVDGVEVDGTTSIGHDRLGVGVTIELNRRVVLLLHEVPLALATGPKLGLVGESLGMSRLRAQIIEAAPSTSPVLIRGETGAGKELVARAVHAASARAERAYRVVNVSAVAPSVAASAFFGHAKGAFSGADQSQPGYFGESDGGTLFLDEVGDLPVDLQPMLLRAIEVGEIQPVGARRSRTVDVRIISATDARLEAAIERGRFSPALLYRLSGIEVRIPPLRDRRDDITRLLVFALRRELASLGDAGRFERPAGRKMWLDARTIAPLCRYPWPGNVRELMNVARQIALTGHNRDKVRASNAPVLDRIHQAVEDAAQAPARRSPAQPRVLQPLTDPPPEGLTDDGVVTALREASWSVPGAANALGVAKSTLYRYLERTQLIRKAADIPDAEIRAVWSRLGGDRRAVSDELRLSPRAFLLRVKDLELPNLR